MGGQETMRQLRALDPAVRAIASSGYSNNSVMANFTKFGFYAAVKKPYQMQEISLVLNEAIKMWQERHNLAGCHSAPAAYM